LKLDPPGTFSILWLYIARSKVDDVGIKDLRRKAAKVDRNKWLGQMLALYLGQLTLDQVRSVVSRGDVTTQEEQNCQVAFYTGEYELQRKNEASAKPLLKQAADACKKDKIEQRAAVAELQRMSR
ncbi:MAG TPA: hypothetical protein VI702_03825, partial [Nitrospiria bacterium]